MDARASIPVTLPRANPTISYWQDPPDADLADYLSADTVPETADVVIIGSGITGGAIAWNLLQQDGTSSEEGGKGAKQDRVVMLEARQACSGATGRNGEILLFSTLLPSPFLSCSSQKSEISKLIAIW